MPCHTLLGCRKTYQDPKGIQRTWESAERRTRPKGSDIDGVGIVAILESETGMLCFLYLFLFYFFG